MMAKQLTIESTKSGLRISGSRDIGSTSDTVVSTKAAFMRVCEHWWNTYCESGKDSGDERTAGDVRYRVCNCNGYTKYDSLEDLERSLNRDTANGHFFQEIKRMVRVETMDMELPLFVQHYNSLVRSHKRER